MRIVLGYEHIQRLLGAHSHLVVELARRLERRGHEVTIVCDTVVDPDLFPDLHFIARRAWKQGESHRLALLYHWSRRVIRNLKPDVSLSFHPAVPADYVVPSFGWIGTRLRREHEFVRRLPRHVGLHMHPNIMERRYVEARLRSDPRVKGLVALSRSMRDLLVYDHPRLDDRVLLIPGASPFEPPEGSNREDDCLAMRARTRSLLGLEPDDLVILWAGRLGLNHGLGLAMRAVARVAEAIDKRRGHGRVRMIVAGNGMWPTHDRAVLLGCPERFMSLGRTREMEHLLTACDVGLLPSVHSIYGRFIWECLAFGRPVIASSRAGGVDRMRSEDGAVAGVVVPPVNLPRLSDAVLEFLSDPAALERARAAARSIAPSMKFDGFVDRIECLLTTGGGSADGGRPVESNDHEQGEVPSRVSARAELIANP